MIKKTVICCLCSSFLLLNSMDRAERISILALDEEALIGLSDEQLSSCYVEAQASLSQVQSQIMKVRAREAERACFASSAGFGALGVGQQRFGYRFGAAYTTSLLTLLGGILHKCFCEKPDRTLITSLYMLRKIETALKAKSILLQRTIQESRGLTGSYSGYQADSEESISNKACHTGLKRRVCRAYFEE